MTTIRCRFRLINIHRDTFAWADRDVYTYIFEPRYDDEIPEHQRFAAATPQGRFEMKIDNPEARAAFELGKDYYFDATPAPKE